MYSAKDAMPLFFALLLNFFSSAARIAISRYCFKKAFCPVATAQVLSAPFKGLRILRLTGENVKNIIPKDIRTTTNLFI
jgi:hypothetical protein